MNTPHTLTIHLSDDRFALLKRWADAQGITVEQLATIFVVAVIDDDAQAHGEKAA